MRSHDTKELNYSKNNRMPVKAVLTTIKKVSDWNDKTKQQLQLGDMQQIEEFLYQKKTELQNINKDLKAALNSDGTEFEGLVREKRDIQKSIKKWELILENLKCENNNLCFN